MVGRLSQRDAVTLEELFEAKAAALREDLERLIGDVLHPYSWEQKAADEKAAAPHLKRLVDALDRVQTTWSDVSGSDWVARVLFTAHLPMDLVGFADTPFDATVLGERIERECRRLRALSKQLLVCLPNSGSDRSRVGRPPEEALKAFALEIMLLCHLHGLPLAKTREAPCAQVLAIAMSTANCRRATVFPYLKYGIDFVRDLAADDAKAFARYLGWLDRERERRRLSVPFWTRSR
jgi:hypothetical protein